MWNFPLHPPADSALATRVDLLLDARLGLAGLVTIAVFFLIVYFSLKYRHGSRANRELPPGPTLRRESHRIEIAWIATPLVLFLGMGLWAAGIYYVHAAPPADATEVYVVGKQWMWKLEHQGGQREIGELHVPAGRPIKLVMTSQDVIHSFFMPVFRIKQDVLPGRYTILWFTATKPGDYHVFCTQYCGTDHARMIGHVVVMAPAAFERWLSSGNASQSPFSMDWLEWVQLSDGSSVIADERYIHDSVMLPRKDIVAGFDPIMPSFQGEIAEDDLLEIIEYIKSLRDANPGAIR